MATAPPPSLPPSQPQPQLQHPEPQTKALATPATVALDNLQAMMNLVLISTGRFLKEQNSGGGSGRMQFAMKRAVPAAEDRFHNELDELENEVTQAQAILRRDLATLKADRKKREQAEAAERQRRAAESSAKKNTTIKSDHVAVSATSASSDVQPQSTEPASRTDEEPLALNRADDLPPTIDTSATPPRDPLFDETPLTANAPDTGFDFDAEFGDLAGGDSTNDQNQDIDMDAAPDLNFLAGLEDFAKSGEDNGDLGQSGADLDLDFAMPDLPDINANVNTEQAPASRPGPSSAPTSTDKPDDSNMLEPTTIDDLDDLFNMDYENPEATQFDDAFFGYGD